MQKPINRRGVAVRPSMRSLAVATGAANLEGFAALGESGDEQKLFRVAPNPEFADKAVNALFDARAYHPRDARFLEAARRVAPHAFSGAFAQANGSHLFTPSPDSLHIPTYMPSALLRYTNNDMIGGRVMPVVKVPNRSDKIGKVPLGTGLSPTDTRLAGQNAHVPELNWNISSTGTFLVNDYGLMSFITADAATNADAPFEVRVTTAEILADTLELMQEIDVASSVGTPGNYASGYSLNVSTAADKWNNDASDPAQQIRTGLRKLLRAPGSKVVLVLGWDVFIALQSHPKILSTFLNRAGSASGATPDLVTEEWLARIFNVDEVLVGRAKKNTANDGQTVSLSDVWTGFAAAIVVQERPNPRATTAWGYQLRYQSESMHVQYIPWQLPGVRGGEYCKVTHSTDTFVASNISGYLWYNVLA